MLLIGRKKQVIGQIHLHAVAFPDRDGGKNVQIAVENMRGRLRQAGSDPLAVGVGRGLADPYSGIGLAESRDQPQRDRDAEDFEVMVIHLIA